MLIVHPIDPTLARTKKKLTKYFNSDELLFVNPGDSNKYYCLHTIKNYPENDTIVFIGHGRSDALYGSKGKYFESRDSVSSEAISQNDDFYVDNEFVYNNNYHLFKHKTVLCFACKSIYLAKLFWDNGAVSILGFDDIPTSEVELFDIYKKKYSKHVVNTIFGCIDIAIIQSIMLAKSINNCDFASLEKIIKYEIQKQIVSILSKKIVFSHTVSNILADIMINVKAIGKRDAIFH